METKKMAERYSRQILFPPIGPKGQERLGASKVVIIGVGALGTCLANNLARAGVGHLVLVDRDFVEESNLQRQVLFDEEDAAQSLPKAVAARNKLAAINSQVRCEAIVTDVNATNIEGIIAGAHLVLDGNDNFEVRFLINDACLKLGIPWIYGACVGSYGLTFNIIPGKTPCLRCVFDTLPEPGTTPTCDTAGIIAPIVNIISSLQSAEALKILVGDYEHLNRGMTVVDLWKNRFENLSLEEGQRPGCEACDLGQYQFLSALAGLRAITLCGRHAVQILPPQTVNLDLEEMERLLQPLGPVSRNRFLLKAELEGCELILFPDGRAIVKGTQDEGKARGIYSKYIGF